MTKRNLPKYVKGHCMCINVLITSHCDNVHTVSLTLLYQVSVALFQAKFYSFVDFLLLIFVVL